MTFCSMLNFELVKVVAVGPTLLEMHSFLGCNSLALSEVSWT